MDVRKWGSDMYNFGPELDPASVAWLSGGAVFPETLEVHLSDDGIRRYAIEDRDEHGVVAALREGRREGVQNSV
ncbi:MAG TPA: hypothetical protein PK117_08030 [Thermomonas sp.]|nr:hypothetical protein [Thermomonas sp.]